MAKLLKNRDGNTYVKDVKLEENPEKLKGLLNDTRWEILKLLAERPRYPAEIADKLDIHEQKVYYHIKQLKKGGIIEVSDRVHRGGAVAKYYRLKDYGFAFELPYGDEKLMDFPVREESEEVRNFLHPFIQNGELNTKIVVGSPDPHGPHQTRARDGHY
ncbi:MAG: ArsR/SmtB family transcription factor, partial [Candidatus Aenigmatarchaeota archaeon]